MPRKHAPQWKPSYRGKHYGYSLKLPRPRRRHKVKFTLKLRLARPKRRRSLLSGFLKGVGSGGRSQRARASVRVAFAAVPVVAPSYLSPPLNLTPLYRCPCVHGYLGISADAVYIQPFDGQPDPRYWTVPVSSLTHVHIEGTEGACTLVFATQTQQTLRLEGVLASDAARIVAMFVRIGRAQSPWRPLPFGSIRLPRYPSGYQLVPKDQRYVWWVLDPVHPHACEDCLRMASQSPYFPPWVEGKRQLNQTPGDGRTRCGADCTCTLSYQPPWPRRPIGRNVQPLSQLEALLIAYTHGQIWHLENSGQLDTVLAEPDIRRWPTDVPEGEADSYIGSGLAQPQTYVRPIVQAAPGFYR